jgi:phosphoenolpyruvate-protein kinase (PTS system EI component)
MTFSVHGLAVSRGIAIGRAVLVASSRADVAHYFIEPAKTEDEITRVRVSRNAVMEEITRVQQDLPVQPTWRTILSTMPRRRTRSRGCGCRATR